MKLYKREVSTKFSTKKIVSYVLTKDMDVVSKWSIVPFPNCKHACVFASVEVNEKFRGKGIGTKLNELRITMARKLGYNKMFCTVLNNNLAQLKVLNKNNWIKMEHINDEVDLFMHP